jgi:hypothetical protein
MSNQLERVHGITHISIAFSNGGITLVPMAANVIKSDISLVAGSSGTVWMAGGNTFPAGVSVGGGMIEVTNLIGLAYTVDGPAKFYLGMGGAPGGTLVVQVVRSLSSGFQGTV